MLDLAKRALPWALAILAVALGVYLWLGRGSHGDADDDDMDSPAGQARGKDEIRIGTQRSGYSELVVIASARKLFASEGVKVKLVTMQNGQKAITRAADRDVDLSVVGDIPFALSAYRDRRAVVVATIGRTTQDVLVFAHRDQGVTRIEDLKGKRVGIEAQESAHYALSLLLKRHGLTEADVTVVELKLKEMSSAFVRGSVAAIADGFADRHSFAKGLRQTKGDDQIELLEKDVFPLHLNLVTTQDFLKKSPDAVKKVLRAVIAAGELVKTDRAGALAAAAEGRENNRKKLAKEWARLTLEVSLAPSLITAMEDQSAWFKASARPGSDAAPPKYRELIQAEPLREIAPALVTLPN